MVDGHWCRAGDHGGGARRRRPDHSFGINIRLPFEQQPNQFISSDPKLVSMKYFFTRKLLLVKESDGYAVLPGGFGTLDEAFELLTLLQTGKAEPAPVVLLEVPGRRLLAGVGALRDRRRSGRGLIEAGGHQPLPDNRRPHWRPWPRYWAFTATTTHCAGWATAW